MFALCMMALSLFEGGVDGTRRKDMSDWVVIDDLANSVRKHMMKNQISAGKIIQTVLRMCTRHDVPLRRHANFYGCPTNAAKSGNLQTTPHLQC
jgi:hypothetical protein